MICQCGGNIQSKEHLVKTSKKADEWAKGLYSENDMPLLIVQKICIGCGRLGYVITNSNNQVIKRFNL